MLSVRSLTLGMKNELTPNEIRRQILRLRQAGKRVNYRHVSKKHGHLFRNACKVFGTWDEVLLACGLDPEEERSHLRWSEAKVKTRIGSDRKAGKDLSSSGVSERDLGLLWAGIRYFGSWDAALRATGINPAFVRRKRALSK